MIVSRHARFPARRTLAIAFGAALGAGAAFALPARSQVPAEPVAAQDALAPFDFMIVPRQAPSTAPIALDVTLKSRLQATGTFQLSAQLVNDAGQAVGSVVRPPQLQLAPGATSAAQVVQLPGPLSDGYYEARVVMAGSDGTSSAVQDAERYFRVAAGRATRVTANEWFGSSNAGRMHP